MENKNDKPETTDNTKDLLISAMAADTKIDSLKEELASQLQLRSKLLGELKAAGHNSFLWKGIKLTIWRKGEGIFTLKGKTKKEETGLLSID